MLYRLVRLVSSQGSFVARTSTFSMTGGFARSSGAFAINAAATFPERCALPPGLIRKSVEDAERCRSKANSEPRHRRGLFLDDRKPAAQKVFDLHLFSRFRF